jgi:type VI protein secretion system component Hcp
MATEYFLVINGVAGDYTDASHQLTGAFAVNSFDLPISTATSGGGGGLGKTSFDPLKLSLNSETLAGLLAASASSSTKLTDVSLVGRTTINGKTVITSSLNLSDVAITNVSETDIKKGFDLTIDYGQIGLITSDYDSKGSKQGSQTFGFDVQANQNTGNGGTSLTNAGGSTVASTTPVTYYLLVDKVNGGSTDPAHKGWFELKDFNFNLANSTDPQTSGGGAGAGLNTFSDLSVSTLSEAGLTALLAQQAIGKGLAGVRVEGVDSLGNAVYDLNLATVHVTKIDDKDSAGFGNSFDYDKISLVTKGENSKQTPVQTGAFGWDVAQNTSISSFTVNISAGAAAATTTATDYFLVINGVAGDYLDPSHQLTGAFAVNSFDLPTSSASLQGGGGGVGKTSFDPLKLSLNSESLAGLLAASASSSNKLTDVSLVGRTTISGKTVITSSLNLSDVAITNVSETDIKKGFDLTIDYGQIGLITTGYDSKGGKQGSQTFGYDVQTNQNTGNGGTSLTNAGAAVASTTPVTYYLLVDKVNGGSTDAAHKGWFELKDFNFNLANSTNPQTSGGGGGAGKNTFGDLSVSTLSEAGLTALLAQEAVGKTLVGVRVEGVDSLGTAVYDLNLAKVHVTKIDDKDSAGFGISFDYDKISLVTKGENSKQTPVQTGAFGWDVAQNASIGSFTVNISPCYCPGTLILTGHGEVPVETLAIGDTVMTMSGAARPIKWIGRRSYAGRFVLGQKDILPVCIKAGAINENVPRRDLWISPHHAMYLEGVLIEARDLVNDVTVFQAERVEKVEYFHIELETHDVLIAEGSLSESFIDDDSRNMFHNAHEFGTLYPGELDRPARYCAPRCADGYEVDSARRRLAGRAGLRTLHDEVGIGTLRGYVDRIGAEIISGWAQNVDHPEAPVCLDVYADGHWVGQTLANRYRGDLERAGLGSGRHSFEFVPPVGLVSSSIAIEVRRALDGAALGSSHAMRKATAA